jgi:hypothetical protein
MRTIMAVRNKEMRLLHSSKLCKVPTSTCKGKVNCEEQNIEQLASIRICWRPALSETGYTTFFLKKSMWAKLKTVFIISHTVSPLLIKKGKSYKHQNKRNEYKTRTSTRERVRASFLFSWQNIICI